MKTAYKSLAQRLIGMSCSLLPLPLTAQHLSLPDGIEGSTTVFDLKHKQWHYTDERDALHESLPASTFKILHSCIALEEGAVADERQVLKWDGTVNKFLGEPFAAWNADTDMEQAYRNSTIWFYAEMARRVGRPVYRRYFKASSYGNGDLRETGTDFWNYGTFGVTPVGQINFLRKLYSRQLPFSERTYAIVQRIMRTEHDGGVFYEKTGWTRQDGKDIGWYVGFVEQKANVYFFATRLTKKALTAHPGFGALRKSVTIAVLKKLAGEK
ncbi:serine hydrolase [Pedobacter yulinensis]|uniref:Serine hydrolase n=1 Tax=Pedobacter yulinensis TaxID=2126353 RepID=A0A2T3HL73_9SPHI|nr:penicillin-binding transpeptidase domain-containing protein [Pedobacter yulinensis]PST83197.1 serine hydrolase [Pedobacter yulinensis]